MEKVQVLNRRNDFNKAYSHGKSFVSPVLVIYIVKNYKKGVRYGITTSKKIGNAVARNRARRVIKESFRKISPSLNGNADFVFVARKQTTNVKSTRVQKEMMDLLKKSGFYRNLKEK